MQWHTVPWLIWDNLSIFQYLALVHFHLRRTAKVMFSSLWVDWLVVCLLVCLPVSIYVCLNICLLTLRENASTDFHEIFGIGLDWYTIQSGSRFNMKMSSYQYMKCHCGVKMVVRSSYLHNGISDAGKMTPLYWIRTLEHLEIATFYLLVTGFFFLFSGGIPTC